MCHHYAKNCQIWWKFDVVITKIILLVFFRHGVYSSFVYATFKNSAFQVFCADQLHKNCSTNQKTLFPACRASQDLSNDIKKSKPEVDHFEPLCMDGPLDIFVETWIMYTRLRQYQAWAIQQRYVVMKRGSGGTHSPLC